MTIDSRILSLEQKHADLEKTLRRAYITHSDDSEIIRIKKEKLSLKEELEDLKNKFYAT